MAWGRGLLYRNLLATAATVLMGSFANEPARSADLGGDCCADLEERVAELEATTVRKGNKKVSITLYGDVNHQVLFWDDGIETNAYVENNSYKTSRFGLKGTAKIGGDWTSGYRLEIESRNARSRDLDQFDDDNADDPNGPLFVRHSWIYLANKKYGEARLGLTWSPKDDITKDTHVLEQLVDTMHSDFFNNQSFFLVSKLVPGNSEALTAGQFGGKAIRFIDLARCYSTSSALFDCSTRRNMAVYVTPVWYGFWFNVGYGEDDIWSASARFKKDWDTWRVGAGVAYEQFTDEQVQNGAGGVPFQDFRRDLREWAGEASVLHKPSGVWANFSWTFSEDRDSNTINAGIFDGKSAPDMFAWDISGGIQKKWWDLGNTTLWGGYTNSSDGIGGFVSPLFGANPGRSLRANSIPGIGITTEVTGSEVTKWYLAADQSIDSAALDLYIGYQHITPEIDLIDSARKRVNAPLEHFDLVFTGARIYF
jgi:predicted porin